MFVIDMRGASNKVEQGKRAVKIAIEHCRELLGRVGIRFFSDAGKMAIFSPRTGRSRETHRSHRCIAPKFFQRGNIPRRGVRSPRRFYSAEKCNAQLVLFPRSRLRTVPGSASAGLPSSSEYDPVVSAEKRRTAARLFQIILLAHSPVLLRETSFLHRRAEAFCGERGNFFRCFRCFRRMMSRTTLLIE